MICDNWIDGFLDAKQQGYQAMLFVDSGTVFTDWVEWKTALDEYPHRGLIGHIVWKKDKDRYPWLHPQCWYIEGDLIDMVKWDAQGTESFAPVPSEKNIHDDYTPLYVKPDTTTLCECPQNQFGQNLIATQLSRQLPVVNWNQKMRGLKHYLYADNPAQEDLWKSIQKEYLDLAENQFWILNNQSIKIYPGHRQLSPAAGLHWIVNICHPGVDKIDIVDISIQQIDFAQHLWQQWDGRDYGQQVVNFIQSRQLKHYEIDQPDLNKIDRLKLKNHSYLKQYVNEKFSKLVGENFEQHWRNAQQTKTVTFTLGNLVKWVIDNGSSKFDSIWLSNILDYKWTMLNSTKQEFENFKKIIERHDSI